MVVNTGKQITCGDLLTSKHQNVADKQYHTNNDWSKQPMDHTVESHAIVIIIILLFYWVLKK